MVYIIYHCKETRAQIQFDNTSMGKQTIFTLAMHFSQHNARILRNRSCINSNSSFLALSKESSGIPGAIWTAFSLVFNVRRGTKEIRHNNSLPPSHHHALHYIQCNTMLIGRRVWVGPSWEWMHRPRRTNSVHEHGWKIRSPLQVSCLCRLYEHVTKPVLWLLPYCSCSLVLLSSFADSLTSLIDVCVFFFSTARFVDHVTRNRDVTTRASSRHGWSVKRNCCATTVETQYRQTHMECWRWTHPRYSDLFLRKVLYFHIYAHALSQMHKAPTKRCTRRRVLSDTTAVVLFLSLAYVYCRPCTTSTLSKWM